MNPENLMKIYESWSEQNQVIVFCTLCVLILLVVGGILSTIRIILRGHATNMYDVQLAEKKLAISPRQQYNCEHDDNLTRRCLKTHGCKTQQECDSMVKLQNGCHTDE